MRLLDFVMLGAEQQHFGHQALSMAKEALGFSNFDSLSAPEKEEAKEFMEQAEGRLIEDYQRELLASFDLEGAKKLVRYGKVLYLNFSQIRDPANTFVLPLFIKPGSTHFMLRAPEDPRIKARMARGARVRILNYQTKADAHFRFYYNRHVVPFRAERVPGCKLFKYQELTVLINENRLRLQVPQS